MSDEQGPPSGPAGPRKRPGPTIDLKATEIGSEPGAGAESPPRTEAGAQRASPLGAALAWLPSGLPWPLIGAGVGGAVVALLLVLIAGQFSGHDGGSGPQEARLARVEQQVRDLAARPAATSVDPKTVDDLTSRVGKLEAVVAAPRPPATDPALANRMATLEGQLKSIDEKVGIVARRTDDIGTIARNALERANATAAALAELAQKVARPAPQTVEHSEVDALATRIAALEKAAKQIEVELGKRVAPETTDRAARLATVAAALDAAAGRGEPFAPQLAAVKSLAADPKVLAALEPFASTGVPSAPALARELLALLPTLAKAAGTPPREGFLDRLAANAEKIVRVRPVEEVPGDDPAAILARVEVRAAQADIAGALAELAKLPAPVREGAAAWIAKVEARNAALASSRRLAADAFAALGKAP